MKENLENYLKVNFDLDNHLIEKCISEFSSHKFKRKDFFLKTGEICNKIAFLGKGAMYCVYNKDGNHKVDEFSLEGKFITDYLSFLAGIPADKDIICLEDCEVLLIGKDTLTQLYKSNPEFERLGRLIAEGLYINWHLKAKSLTIDDAETRYQKLVSSRPDLIQRVPQYLIASYLNVSPETISRIRKK
jgi:CRP-like cAMP-binding protein